MMLGELTWISTELDALDRDGALPDCDRGALLARGRALVERARALPSGELRLGCATRLARLLNDADRVDEALTVLGEAEPLLARFRRTPRAVAFGRERVRALAALARRSGDRGRWAEVDASATPLIDLFEEQRALIAPPPMFSAVAASAIDLYAASVEARLALGRDADAVAVIERVKCRSLQRLVAAPAAVGASTRATFDATCRTIDALVEAGRPVPDRLVHERRHLAAQLDFERFRVDVAVSDFSVAELQSRLTEETAAVSWFWLDRLRLAVVAITRGGLATAIVPIDEALRADLDRRADAVLVELDRLALRSAVKLPRRLASALFPPSIRALLAGQRRLVLSPHRGLHALPLHILPWEPQATLFHAFAISYAPNLTTLLRPARPVTREPRALFVGVPQRGPALVTRSLPGIFIEHADVRATWGERVTTRMGPESTKGELAALAASGVLAAVELVHLACHGTSVSSENPMESRLLLFDADLDGLEIARWRLAAHVVVLSACNSGQRPFRAPGGAAAPDLAGDEVFGLQAAFFAAGAERVLACLWPADDAVTPQVMRDFHEAWQHMPADLALREAMLTCVGRGLTRAEVPELWAGYTLTVTSMPEPEGATHE